MHSAKHLLFKACFTLSSPAQSFKCVKRTKKKEYMQLLHPWYFYRLTSLIATPCCCCAHCNPSCVPHVTMRHSLAKPQASGMHVALDRLPAPGLAAPRHHAPHAVAATGPCPSPRASTTPAVTGPRWGSSTTLPTLIHSPTGWNGGVGRRQGKHGQTDPREGTNKTKKREIDERQTHRAGEQKCYELVKSMTKTLHRHSV